MEVVSANNLGLQRKDPGWDRLKEDSHEPGLPPVKQLKYKFINESERDSRAVNASQTQEFYKVKGAFVDRMV